MIQRAMVTATPQITPGEPQVIDMRGSGLREEIMEIMRRHGIDAETGGRREPLDASAYATCSSRSWRRSPGTGSTPTSTRRAARLLGGEEKYRAAGPLGATSLSSIRSITWGSTGRSPAPVGGALDRVDRVHAVGDLAEDGVLAVEPRRPRRW